MKKMFIVLTSALLIGSGLYSMESKQADKSEAAEQARGILIALNSTWDPSTGLLNVRDGETLSTFTRQTDGSWVVGDAREQAAAAKVPAERSAKLDELVKAIEARYAVLAPMKVVAQDEVRTRAKFLAAAAAAVARARMIGQHLQDNSTVYRVGVAGAVAALEIYTGVPLDVIGYVGATVIPGVILTPEVKKFVRHSGNIVTNAGHVGCVVTEKVRKIRKSVRKPDCSIQ